MLIGITMILFASQTNLISTVVSFPPVTLETRVHCPDEEYDDHFHTFGNGQLFKLFFKKLSNSINAFPTSRTIF